MLKLIDPILPTLFGGAFLLNPRMNDETDLDESIGKVKLNSNGFLYILIIWTRISPYGPVADKLISPESVNPCLFPCVVKSTEIIASEITNWDRSVVH